MSWGAVRRILPKALPNHDISLPISATCKTRCGRGIAVDFRGCLFNHACNIIFFDETPDIPRKDDLTFAFICSNAFFIAFNFFPSLNPFSCSECNLMKDTSAVLNKKFADNPLPAHKGDRTCVWCFADDSAEASVFECGHDVACRDCFHIFMAHGHKRCLRCGAKRVY